MSFQSIDHTTAHRVADKGSLTQPLTLNPKGFGKLIHAGTLRNHLSKVKQLPQGERKVPTKASGE